MLIRHRSYRANWEGEKSFIDYQIQASMPIIDEIDRALQAIERKYPKLWEKKQETQKRY